MTELPSAAGAGERAGDGEGDGVVGVGAVAAVVADAGAVEGEAGDTGLSVATGPSVPVAASCVLSMAAATRALC